MDQAASELHTGELEQNKHEMWLKIVETTSLEVKLIFHKHFFLLKVIYAKGSKMKTNSNTFQYFTQ